MDHRDEVGKDTRILELQALAALLVEGPEHDLALSEVALLLAELARDGYAAG